MCRKSGVTEFSCGTFTCKLGELPSAKAQQQADADQNEVPSDNPWSQFPDRILTNEELTYYSTGGAQGEAPPEVTDAN